MFTLKFPKRKYSCKVISVRFLKSCCEAQERGGSGCAIHKWKKMWLTGKPERMEIESFCNQPQVDI